MTKYHYTAGQLAALTKLGFEPLPEVPDEYKELFEDPNIGVSVKREMLQDMRGQQAGHSLPDDSEYRSRRGQQGAAIGAGGGLMAGGIAGAKRKGIPGAILGGLGGAAAGAGLGGLGGMGAGQLEHTSDQAEQGRAVDELEHPYLMGRTLSDPVQEAREDWRGEEGTGHEDQMESQKALAEALRQYHTQFSQPDQEQE